MTKQDLMNEIRESILGFHYAEKRYKKTGGWKESPPDVNDYVRRVMIAVDKFINYHQGEKNVEDNS